MGAAAWSPSRPGISATCSSATSGGSRRTRATSRSARASTSTPPRPSTALSPTRTATRATSSSPWTPGRFTTRSVRRWTSSRRATPATTATWSTDHLDLRVGTGALDGCPGPATCNDYAASFGGTSHASPTIAGTAALVLSATRVRLGRGQGDPAANRGPDRLREATRWPVRRQRRRRRAEFSQWYGHGAWTSRPPSRRRSCCTSRS